ncbi:MAG TPA: metalloregulator ArsR/SmtB family transcription factor [Candidatus Dormibacteraeota bacterium]|nr:metalloregulator ArsR/SmtB family transcription factor [Candidatus Dormibacteraeota bacterium]
MVPLRLLEEAARRFALLGDVNRLRILSTLHEHGEQSTSQLAEKTSLATANVSQHLSRLMAAGLVSRRREGQHAYYTVSDSTVASLCDIVCSSVRERAAGLAQA